jgi:excisionase family DNA binding protein
MEKLLSVDETASLLGLKKSTIYKMTCLKNSIPFLKLGTRVLFRPSELESWLSAHSHGPESAIKIARKVSAVKRPVVIKGGVR